MNKRTPYRKQLNKTACVLISLVCVWATAGHVLWNVVRQASYSYVHYLKSERSFRDTLTLSENVFSNRKSVTWHKKNEISYAGRMFDIKKIIKGSGNIVLIGHYDDLEHHLYKYLQKLFGNDNDKGAPKRVSFFSFTAVLPGAVNTTVTFFFVDRLYFTCWKNRFYYHLSISPPHAPPDALLQYYTS